MSDLRVEPVTADRWDDLAALFGPNGAYAGCWCMFFRQTSKEFSAKAGARNRDELHALVNEDRIPGLLAYRDGAPAGWVSLAPRPEFGRIERSPILKPVDDRPVWSIVCFFIHRAHRGRGVASALLDAGVEHARAQGAAVVEGYPIDLAAKDRKIPAAELYVGTLELFLGAGFREIARHAPARPIVRLELDRPLATFP